MRNLFLIGFSYTGKSSAGRLAAERLGLPFVDLDERIERRAGRSIPEIFEAEGEAAFRALEREALAEVCAEGGAVVATGGGVPVDAENRRRMRESGVVVLLEARPETIRARQTAADSGAEQSARPMLAGGDPLQRIAELKAERRDAYGEAADWTVHTDALDAGGVAAEIARGYEIVAAEPGAAAGRPTITGVAPSYTVTTKAGTYHGYVGSGLLEKLGALMRNAGLDGTAFVIADGAVFDLYGEPVMASLKDAGFEAYEGIADPGESSKSLELAGDIYGWLAGRRAERRDCVVALGGGVAGDLGGFIAATYLRGMPFVQVPTTLLAMVDASIGGKVAVNLPAGKNLVGAFHQPRLVLADVEALRTLPHREMTAGWAEVVKHGLILDRSLLDDIDRERDRLLDRDPGALADIITRSAAIKARVVTEDERETSGMRNLLNYGHTVGHALEAVLDYEGLLHGEAVAIGMSVAAEIAVRMRMLTGADLERQADALRSFGLPMKGPAGIDQAAVREAMALDKKVAGKRINWVLLDGIGNAVSRNDVPEDVVREAMAAILG